MLYSLSSIPVSVSETYDDSICQGIFNVYPSAKLCIAVAYRPPDASLSSFSKLIDSFTLAIENLAPSDYDVFITGDFNFPQIDWETLSIMSGGTSDSTISAQYLLDFMSTHLLSQVATVQTWAPPKMLQRRREAVFHSAAAAYRRLEPIFWQHSHCTTD